jgi:hypothetical protein
MTVRSTARGSAARPITLYTDSYGFVRDQAEVGLTVMTASAPPDHALVDRLLKTLRTRASKQFAASSSHS